VRRRTARPFQPSDRSDRAGLVPWPAGDDRRQPGLDLRALGLGARAAAGRRGREPRRPRGVRRPHGLDVLAAEVATQGQPGAVREAGGRGRGNLRARPDPYAPDAPVRNGAGLRGRGIPPRLAASACRACGEEGVMTTVTKVGLRLAPSRRLVRKVLLAAATLA